MEYAKAHISTLAHPRARCTYACARTIAVLQVRRVVDIRRTQAVVNLRRTRNRQRLSAEPVDFALQEAAKPRGRIPSARAPHGS